MRGSIRILLLVVPAVLVIARQAGGGIAAPNSSLTTSRDGRRVLVMLSPQPEYDQTPTAALPDGRVINLHDEFSKSGVYDSSTLKPIWQVDWFSLRCDLLCSDDLQHVARLNRLGYRAKWAIAFYDGGKEACTYNCAFLLTRMRAQWCLPFSEEEWDLHTQWYGDFKLDPGRRNVWLSTARRRLNAFGPQFDLGFQEFYTFDLASGALVSRRTAGAWVVWAYGTTLGSLLVVLSLAGRWSLRMIRATRYGRGFPVAQASYVPTTSVRVAGPTSRAEHL